MGETGESTVDFGYISKKYVTYPESHLVIEETVKLECRSLEYHIPLFL